jgi:hypothetical protein
MLVLNPNGSTSGKKIVTKNEQDQKVDEETSTF